MLAQNGVANSTSQWHGASTGPQSDTQVSPEVFYECCLGVIAGRRPASEQSRQCCLGGATGAHGGHEAVGPQLLQDAMHVGAQLPSKTVRVGTDCSGLEAPLLALRAMQVPFHHVFSSEINPRKRKFIEAMFCLGVGLL